MAILTPKNERECSKTLQALVKTYFFSKEPLQKGLQKIDRNASKSDFKKSYLQNLQVDFQFLFAKKCLKSSSIFYLSNLSLYSSKKKF